MTHLEWMAVGWGGTVAGLGLIVISTGEGMLRFAVMIALCLLAGFLAGVRAEDRRVFHAAVVALAAAAFWAIFVALTTLVDILSGPGGASWRIGGDSQVRNLVTGFVAAIVGGAIAAHRLRPQGRTRRSGD